MSGMAVNAAEYQTVLAASGPVLELSAPRQPSRGISAPVLNASR